jgi:hypothetical protein
LAGKGNVLKVSFLERSGCGCVAEVSSTIIVILITQMQVRNFHPTNVPGGVLRLKMLFVINNGVIEYIQIIAPHEEWTYRNANRTQVNFKIEEAINSFLD